MEAQVYFNNIKKLTRKIFKSHKGSPGFFNLTLETFALNICTSVTVFALHGVKLELYCSIVVNCCWAEILHTSVNSKLKADLFPF